MGVATLMSRILGLVREQVFAFLFGASDAADAFNIAFRIPNLLRDLFAEGAMSAAFVPNFTKALVKSKRQAFDLLFAVLCILLLGLSALSILGIALSPQLVALYAGSFQTVPGKYEMAVQLTQLMFPFFPMVAMAAVAMGALNALGFFFLPAFAPVLFNVASILCGVVLCPLLNTYTNVPAIYGMAVGVVLGGFFQFYIQWWQVRRQGLSLLDRFSVLKAPWKVQGVGAVLWLLIPGTIGLAATQLNILINSMYATSQGSGAVSWLNYAFRLMQFPIGIFGVSLAAATLPQVSRKIAEKKISEASDQVCRSLEMTFSVNGPAAAGLIALGLPIIQLLFQHGRFTYSDAVQTSQALGWYALGLPAYSAVKVLVPVYYALGTTRFPVVISFLAVALNAALNHYFLQVLHYPFWALAMATSVTVSLNAVLLYLRLGSKLSGVVRWRLARSFLLHTLISLGVAGVAWGTVKGLTHFYAQENIFSWCLQVVTAMFTCGLFWLGAGKIFGISEITTVFSFFQKKLCRKPKAGSKIEA